ncbi:Malectin-like domain [Dillenia turbinata]|uniref:Malectin-like domain n=1 Tax=Dillenia turbinata TaxID=194707 RepID=A0AAN8YYB9_9MAGN
MNGTPFTMRISCGARFNVHTAPTNTFWFKEFAYTGGIPANASLPSFISPPLRTLRFFPLSDGPENCYTLTRVPQGHYAVRIYFGLVDMPNFDNEPLFDISVKGTLIYSMKLGWTHDDGQAFSEVLVFIKDRSVSICFHSTGHVDPAILAISILQIDDNAYNSGPNWVLGTILRTAKRLNCGSGTPKLDEDYSGDQWGGDRFWNVIQTFGDNIDMLISVENSIKQVSLAPNFYPEALYQSAIVSTDNQPDLEYTTDVDPNRNYSVWLHFAKIDPAVTAAGQRIFDILINGEVVIKMWIL